MKNKFRIKHKPTGLYVKPITSNSYVNLTTKDNAKVYDNLKAFNNVVGRLYSKGKKLDLTITSDDWYYGLYKEGSTEKIYIEDKKEFEIEYLDPKNNTEPQLYIARDKSGVLFGFTEEPEKDEETGGWLCSGFFMPLIDNDLYKDVTWESGPNLILINNVIKY